MKIICIGRNYAEHAKELGNEIPKEPLFFLKPDSAILPHKHPLFIPEFTKDLHFEVELVYRICRLGKHIEAKHASKYYDAVVQEECKKKGAPWEKAKAFDGSAAISKDFVMIESLSNSSAIQFELRKNGETKQSSDSSHMIFSIDKIIEHVSQYMTLKIGDLIYTGTPSGVGPVVMDDVLECYLEGKKMLKVEVK
jgi:2-keto-4-pentenoate hydratase/2-oxohepta-3-ene-1,7-dioic acid hydratase in catechol pathway